MVIWQLTDFYKKPKLDNSLTSVFQSLARICILQWENCYVGSAGTATEARAHLPNAAQELKIRECPSYFGYF